MRIGDSGIFGILPFPHSANKHFFYKETKLQSLGLELEDKPIVKKVGRKGTTFFEHILWS